MNKFSIDRLVDMKLLACFKIFFLQFLKKMLNVRCYLAADQKYIEWYLNKLLSKETDSRDIPYSCRWQQFRTTKLWYLLMDLIFENR